MSTSTTPRLTVKVGTQFRSAYADSNALWKVTRKVGAQAWEAEIQNEPIEVSGRMIPSDYVGTVKLFSSREILATLRASASLANHFAKADQWWEGRPIGSVAHYHNAFGQWVRGEIVEHKGKRCLRPTALVGTWRPSDLPRRYPLTGEAVGYTSGGHFLDPDFEPWQPSFGCMFESGRTSEVAGDPTTMEAIDLSLPEVTDDQARAHRLMAVVEDVRILLDPAPFESSEDIARALRKVRRLLTSTETADIGFD